jgi:hypothetical protein
VSDLNDLEFMLLLDAKPDRCEDCADGTAHQHANGDLVACRTRCPGCIYCPRADEEW